MKRIEVEDYDELKKLCSTAEIPLIVKFSAVWCGPCRLLAKEFNDCTENIILCEVDVDKCDIGKRFNARRLPYLVRLDKEGNVISEHLGYAAPSDILKILGAINV